MHLPHPVAGSIVIVEGDANVRELQGHFLREAGFAPEFVNDGEAAFDRVRSILPAAIVTEILVPKLDGLALCRRIREDPLTRHIPILVFSILAAEARAAEAGATAFLRKPLVDTTFIASVRRMIESRKPGATEQQWVSK